MKHLKLFEEFNPDDVLDKISDGMHKINVAIKSPSLRRIIRDIQNDQMILNCINHGIRFDFAEEEGYPGFDQTAKCLINRRLREILSNKDYYLFAQNSEYVNNYLNLHESPSQPLP